MDDKKYFQHYKKSFEEVFLNVDDCIFIKDSDFRYQLGTEKLAKFFGIDFVNNIIGKNIDEVAISAKFEDKNMINQFSEQDLKISQQKKNKIYLDIIVYGKQNKIYVRYNYPIINPETNNFVGIRGYFTDLLWPHPVKTLLKMHGCKGLLINQKINKNSLKDYQLSSMQHMILFLCLNNYSYSEIALLLNEFGYSVTPARVNDYLEQLKLIFHVRNKTQLVEKAIGLNFHLFLPEGLFNKSSSIDISQERAIIIGNAYSI